MRSRPKLLTLEDRRTPTAVTWDGGAGTLNWSDADNWNPNGLPGVGDDVTIDAAGTVTVTHDSGTSTIKSLTLSDSLTVSGGTLNVTDGLTVNAIGLLISASGSGVSLNGAGPSNIDNSSLNVMSGAKISLSGLNTYDASKVEFPYWRADGNGSELNLSAVTSAFPGYGHLQATAANGGSVKLNSLSLIGLDWGIHFQADGTGSTIDIPSLKSYTGNGGFYWGLSASNGGAIHAPALTVIDYVAMYLDGKSSIDTAQMVTLCYGRLTVSGGNPDFSSLVNLDESGVVAMGGATLTFPSVKVFEADDAYPPARLRAQGAGTILDLPNCTLLRGSVYNTFSIEAINGGRVKLDNVPSIDPTLGQHIVADGTGSVVELPLLSSMIGDGTFALTMTTSNNGVIQLPATGTFQVANTTVSNTTGGSITTSSLNLGKGSFLEGTSLTSSVTGIGTIRPAGDDAGTLTISGNVALSPGSSLQMQIKGASAGNYDSLAVNGAFSLSGTSLATTVDFSPSAGSTFTIVDNDSNDPVVGVFTALPNGATAATAPNGLFLVINYAGGDGNDVTLRAVPQVVQIEDGMIQRSMVRTIKVTFSEPVSLGANAFSLNGPSGITINASLDGTGTIATLTFSGAAIIGGSLPDGVFALTIDGSAITVVSSGLALDANADGSPGGSQAFQFHRLFGDADGNGTVSAADFNAFRLAYGTTGVSIFDFNGDNQVSASDFNQFRTRYGTSLVP